MLGNDVQDELSVNDVEQILDAVPLDEQARVDETLDRFYNAGSIEERRDILRDFIGDADRMQGLEGFLLSGGDRSELRLLLMFEISSGSDELQLVEELRQLRKELNAVDKLIATVKARLTGSVS